MPNIHVHDKDCSCLDRPDFTSDEFARAMQEAEAEIIAVLNDLHPVDCKACEAGEGMKHAYEPSDDPEAHDTAMLITEIPWRF